MLFYGFLIVSRSFRSCFNHLRVHPSEGPPLPTHPPTRPRDLVGGGGDGGGDGGDGGGGGGDGGGSGSIYFHF